MVKVCCKNGMEIRSGLRRPIRRGGGEGRAEIPNNFENNGATSQAFIFAPFSQQLLPSAQGLCNGKSLVYQ